MEKTCRQGPEARERRIREVEKKWGRVIEASREENFYAERIVTGI